ncbi:hypothetical protein BaRGS_00024154 [Batillaria attramentaria]|uniref:THAP-type domain-containing protein n=1 Tax=Batillaria attramentaria TaxID=370345 RepID=A0ABD0KBY4_9CAEN
MPSRCVVGGCSNIARDGISLHGFPADQDVRRKWDKFVLNSRKDWWVGKGVGSVTKLCSAHFHSSDFDGQVAAALGYKKTLTLKRSAVPTMLRPVSREATEQTNAARKRRADSKLEVARLLSTGPTVTYCKQNQNVVPKMTGPSLEHEADQSAVHENVAPKITGTCLEHEVDQSAVHENVVPKMTGPSLEHEADQSAVHEIMVPKMIGTSLQLEVDQSAVHKLGPELCTKGTQKGLNKPYYRSKGIQVNLADIDEATSPDTDTTQWSPGLSKLAKLPDTFQSQQEAHMIKLTGDPNQQTQENQSPQQQDDTLDEEWKPTWSKIRSSRQQEKPDFTGKTALVFISQLLQLFTVCLRCKEETKGDIVEQQGTCLIVHQRCIHCGFFREWYSQPFIRKTAKGNLLVSAAVLFSGAIFAKCERLFALMKMVFFSRGNFFYHQRKYLVPAVIRTWRMSQATILRQLSERGLPLQIAGVELK